MVLAWYVYHEGQQLWLFGQGPLVDGRAEVPLRIYAGAQFPPAFAAGQVQGEAWGTVSLRFPDADSAQVSWAPLLPDYSAGSLDLVRLTELSGHACAR